MNGRLLRGVNRSEKVNQTVNQNQIIVRERKEKVIYVAENALNYLCANTDSDEVGKIVQSLIGQESNCKQDPVIILYSLWNGTALGHNP